MWLAQESDYDVYCDHEYVFPTAEAAIEWVKNNPGKGKDVEVRNVDVVDGEIAVRWERYRYFGYHGIEKSEEPTIGYAEWVVFSVKVWR